MTSLSKFWTICFQLTEVMQGSSPPETVECFATRSISCIVSASFHVMRLLWRSMFRLQLDVDPVPGEAVGFAVR